LELEVVAKKGVARKALLLMLVNVLLLAFREVMVHRAALLLSSEDTLAPIHAAATAARAASF
jgi:hypothetical protein